MRMSGQNTELGQMWMTSWRKIRDTMPFSRTRESHKITRHGEEIVCLWRKPQITVLTTFLVLSANNALLRCISLLSHRMMTGRLQTTQRPNYLTTLF